MIHTLASPLAISIISVALCAQLIFLPTRTAFGQYFGNDRPRLKLSTASNSRKIACFGHSIPELSLNRQGYWVTHGEPAMDSQQVQQYLHRLTSRESSRGYSPVLRLRIPAQTPAKHFINLTNTAQEVGFQTIYIATWKPKLSR